MKLLHAADLHLDSAFAGLPEEKAALCRQESRDILRRMVDWANDHEADVMLLAGDLFDSDRLYSQTARTLALTLGRFRGRIFLAPGNHDFYVPGGGYERGGVAGKCAYFHLPHAPDGSLAGAERLSHRDSFHSAQEREPFAGAAFAGSEAPFAWAWCMGRSPVGRANPPHHPGGDRKNRPDLPGPGPCPPLRRRAAGRGGGLRLSRLSARPGL